MAKFFQVDDFIFDYIGKVNGELMVLYPEKIRGVKSYLVKKITDEKQKEQIFNKLPESVRVKLQG